MRRALVLLLVVLPACNAVFGFDKADLDPTLVDGGPSSDALTCDAYCDTIMRTCTGDNQEYTSRGVCMAMCKHFEVGLATDTNQDSLACRNYHAHNAEMDPVTHCRHAGPLGGGVCGSDPCNPYCLLDVALCSTQPTPPFSGEAECRMECQKFMYVTTGGATDLGMEMGDTLNCRLYHLESAYAVDNDQAASTHCPHTGTVSATCN